MCSSRVYVASLCVCVFVCALVCVPLNIHACLYSVHVPLPLHDLGKALQESWV